MCGVSTEPPPVYHAELQALLTAAAQTMQEADGDILYRLCAGDRTAALAIMRLAGGSGHPAAAWWDTALGRAVAIVIDGEPAVWSYEHAGSVLRIAPRSVQQAVGRDKLRRSVTADGTPGVPIADVLRYLQERQRQPA